MQYYYVVDKPELAVAVAVETVLLLSFVNAATSSSCHIVG
jgi:hypothetical protein